MTRSQSVASERWRGGAHESGVEIAEDADDHKANEMNLLGGKGAAARVDKAREVVAGAQIHYQGQIPVAREPHRGGEGK